MSGENEIKKALCKTLAGIAEKEKNKAIQNGEYMDAIFAGFVEGFFKQAESSVCELSFTFAKYPARLE